MFGRHKPNDVLFLMPVRRAGERLDKSKVRMLYCDAAGKVYAPVINRSVYELAQENARRMEREHRLYATLGLEVSPGNYTPSTVEIGDNDLWALERILEHALKSGRLPDILKWYVKPIIKLGALSGQPKTQPRIRPELTPRVLNRLPYYSEKDIELSMPIYKAEHSYPLIALKHLPPDEHTSSNSRRLLILDNDGDLAIIKVPVKLMTKLGRGLKEHTDNNDKNFCAVFSQSPDGFAISYMEISQPQKKAMDILTRYFEETGYVKRPIPAGARKVLARAREQASSSVR